MPDAMFKLDVMTVLLAPDEENNYSPIKNGQDKVEEDGSTKPAPDLLFKNVAFGALAQAEFKVDDGKGGLKDEEDLEQRFHRFYLAQRIHEAKGEIEINEDDRTLLKRAIDQHGSQGRIGQWVSYVCLRMLKGMPQTDKPLVVVDESNEQVAEEKKD